MLLASVAHTNEAFIFSASSPICLRALHFSLLMFRYFTPYDDHFPSSRALFPSSLSVMSAPLRCLPQAATPPDGVFLMLCSFRFFLMFFVFL